MEETARKRAEHVRWSVLDNNWNCFHCGRSLPVKMILPAPMEEITMLMKAFEKYHRRCKLTPAGTDLREAYERAWAKHKGEAK